MTGPRQAEIRYRVDPRDVPPEKAARRLHLTLTRFNELLPNLIKRGFPEPDPDTGMFDLDAIDLWRKSRHRSAQSLALAEPNILDVPASREARQDVLQPVPGHGQGPQGRSQR
jgi:hypothetical protein